MKHPLQHIIELQKAHTPVGIYSACSANEFVLEAVLEKAKETNSYALIEATSNQCNQFGGYTGMLPNDFKKLVEKLAENIKLDLNKVILGGDHLGPLTWTHLNEEQAMANAEVLVREYVLAGFTKIHIDTSMRVNDDSITEALSTSVVARRGALLVKRCEEAYQTLLLTKPNATAPVYIIGSEVPIPGGSQETEEEAIQVTTPANFKATVDTFKEAFLKNDLNSAWERVIAVVVQPGVEFGDVTINEYNHNAAIALTSALNDYPNLIFEGHSTDYQSANALREMVKDGIGILKVGPALTFAVREAIFALAHIEEALIKADRCSHFIKVLDDAMLENPSNWKKHYHGSEWEMAFKRQYSYSDRARYYLPNANVQKALGILISNLSTTSIPFSLLSQYMPMQYTKVRNHEIKLEPKALIKDRVKDCINEYLFASQQTLIK